MLNKDNIRSWFSLVGTVLISIILSYYFSLSGMFLTPLTTIFLLIAPIGSALYASIQRIFLLFLIASLFALLSASWQLFFLLAHDISLGAIIGIIANIVIPLHRPEESFREALMPLIQSYQQFFSSSIDLFLNQKTSDFSNRDIEKQLLALPDWVYAPGFDQRLKKGHRFFLGTLEQISDVLFSLHRLARYPFDMTLTAEIRLPLLACEKQINQFFSAILTVLKLKKLSDGVEDFALEIAELEKEFNTLIPLNLELLDINPEYVYLAEFIYNLKDLRALLLKLAESLR